MDKDELKQDVSTTQPQPETATADQPTTSGTASEPAGESEPGQAISGDAANSQVPTEETETGE